MIDHKHIINLYCDGYSTNHNAEDFPDKYEGRDYDEIIMRAKNAGWLIHPIHNISYCPQCAPKFLEPLVGLRNNK